MFLFVSSKKDALISILEVQFEMDHVIRKSVRLLRSQDRLILLSLTTSPPFLVSLTVEYINCSAFCNVISWNTIFYILCRPSCTCGLTLLYRVGRLFAPTAVRCKDEGVCYHISVHHIYRPDGQCKEKIFRCPLHSIRPTHTLTYLICTHVDHHSQYPFITIPHFYGTLILIIVLQ